MREREAIVDWFRGRRTNPLEPALGRGGLGTCMIADLLAGSGAGLATRPASGPVTAGWRRGRDRRAAPDTKILSGLGSARPPAPGSRRDPTGRTRAAPRACPRLPRPGRARARRPRTPAGTRRPGRGRARPPCGLGEARPCRRAGSGSPGGGGPRHARGARGTLRFGRGPGSAARGRWRRSWPGPALPWLPPKNRSGAEPRSRFPQPPRAQGAVILLPPPTGHDPPA